MSKPKIKSISFAFDEGHVEFHRGPHVAPSGKKYWWLVKVLTKTTTREWYSDVRQPSVIRALEWLAQTPNEQLATNN